jgi:hypothetical protein
MNNTPFSIDYQRFVNLVKAIQSEPTYPNMDAVESSLLDGFAAVWYTGKRITVLEAMNMWPDISPSTVHRRLKSLRAKGMLTLVNDTTDSRTKYVTPTDLAMQYFDQLGKCMEAALKQN